MSATIPNSPYQTTPDDFHAHIHRWGSGYRPSRSVYVVKFRTRKARPKGSFASKSALRAAMEAKRARTVERSPDPLTDNEAMKLLQWEPYGRRSD